MTTSHTTGMQIGPLIGVDSLSSAAPASIPALEASNFFDELKRSTALRPLPFSEMKHPRDDAHEYYNHHSFPGFRQQALSYGLTPIACSRNPMIHHPDPRILNFDSEIIGGDSLPLVMHTSDSLLVNFIANQREYHYTGFTKALSSNYFHFFSSQVPTDLESPLITTNLFELDAGESIRKLFDSTIFPSLGTHGDVCHLRARDFKIQSKEVGSSVSSSLAVDLYDPIYKYVFNEINRKLAILAQSASFDTTTNGKVFVCSGLDELVNESLVDIEKGTSPLFMELMMCIWGLGSLFKYLNTQKIVDVLKEDDEYASTIRRNLGFYSDTATLLDLLYHGAPESRNKFFIRVVFVLPPRITRLPLLLANYVVTKLGVSASSATDRDLIKNISEEIHTSNIISANNVFLDENTIKVNIEGNHKEMPVIRNPGQDHSYAYVSDKWVELIAEQIALTVANIHRHYEEAENMTEENEESSDEKPIEISPQPLVIIIVPSKDVANIVLKYIRDQYTTTPIHAALAHEIFVDVENDQEDSIADMPGVSKPPVTFALIVSGNSYQQRKLGLRVPVISVGDDDVDEGDSSGSLEAVYTGIVINIGVSVTTEGTGAHKCSLLSRKESYIEALEMIYRNMGPSFLNKSTIFCRPDNLTLEIRETLEDIDSVKETEYLWKKNVIHYSKFDQGGGISQDLHQLVILMVPDVSVTVTSHPSTVSSTFRIRPKFISIPPCEGSSRMNTKPEHIERSIHKIGVCILEWMRRMRSSVEDAEVSTHFSNQQMDMQHQEELRRKKRNLRQISQNDEYEEADGSVDSQDGNGWSVQNILPHGLDGFGTIIFTEDALRLPSNELKPASMSSLLSQAFHYLIHAGVVGAQYLVVALRSRILNGVFFLTPLGRRVSSLLLPKEKELETIFIGIPASKFIIVTAAMGIPVMKCISAAKHARLVQCNPESFRISVEILLATPVPQIMLKDPTTTSNGSKTQEKETNDISDCLIEYATQNSMWPFKDSDVGHPVMNSLLLPAFARRERLLNPKALNIMLPPCRGWYTDPAPIIFPVGMDPETLEPNGKDDAAKVRKNLMTLASGKLISTKIVKEKKISRQRRGRRVESNSAAELSNERKILSIDTPIGKSEELDLSQDSLAHARYARAYKFSSFLSEICRVTVYDPLKRLLSNVTFNDDQGVYPLVSPQEGQCYTMPMVSSDLSTVLRIALRNSVSNFCISMEQPFRLQSNESECSNLAQDITQHLKYCSEILGAQPLSYDAYGDLYKYLLHTDEQGPGKNIYDIIIKKKYTTEALESICALTNFPSFLKNSLAVKSLMGVTSASHSAGVWLDSVYNFEYDAPKSHDNLLHINSSRVSYNIDCAHTQFRSVNINSQLQAQKQAIQKGVSPSEEFVGRMPTDMERKYIDGVIKGAKRMGREKVEGSVRGNSFYAFINEDHSLHPFYVFELRKSLIN